MLLFDRFPGKAHPKDECLATNNNTRLIKVYSLIEVPFILLFMNRAWIRINQLLFQIFPRLRLIRHYY